MPRTKIRVVGTTLVVGGTRIQLMFLEQQISTGDGGTEFRVKVKCHGCGRSKSVARVGLRFHDGVLDLQSNCVDCRGILNVRTRKAS